MWSRGGTDEAVLFSSCQYAPKYLLFDNTLCAGVHLSDVAQRLRAEFLEEAKAGWDDTVSYTHLTLPTICSV
eukprot:5795248-Alexandrium_andersonii.AAC.1